MNTRERGHDISNFQEYEGALEGNGVRGRSRSSSSARSTTETERADEQEEARPQITIIQETGRNGMVNNNTKKPGIKEAPARKQNSKVKKVKNQNTLENHVLRFTRKTLQENQNGQIGRSG